MLAKITVADYMTKHLVKLSPDMNVIDAIQRILDHKITGAPVIDAQGKVIGVFTERDGIKVVLEAAYNQSGTGKVAEFMTDQVVHVEAETSIVDLAEKFQGSSVRSFPVYKDKNLVGIISRTDVLRALTSNA